MTLKICVVDTTFSRVDMGSIAIDELHRVMPSATIHRLTVPGIKDIPGAIKRIIDTEGCDGVIALGWVGKEFVDKLSYVAYSVGVMLVGILSGKIIVDVTVHEDEAPEDKLKNIAEDRVRRHIRNLIAMLKDPKALTRFAGKGLRQGYPDVGPIK